MVKKQESKPAERTRLIVPLEEAQEKVRGVITRGEAVPNVSITEHDGANSWYDYASEVLRQISSTDELRDEFQGRGSFDYDVSTARYLKRLRSIGERLPLLPAPPPHEPHAAGKPRARCTAGSGSRRVFVVHGHDDGTKETVARFLTKLGLEPVILHEQPNRGQTIIEKFEEHADVAFAAVLFTPDDIGYPAGKVEESRPRARQNVVLELGFFIGALGRDRVCMLYKSGVELPSDYAGVAYEELDARGAWRLHVAREMKAAGLDVDLNDAL